MTTCNFFWHAHGNLRTDQMSDEWIIHRNRVGIACTRSDQCETADVTAFGKNMESCVGKQCETTQLKVATFEGPKKRCGFKITQIGEKDVDIVCTENEASDQPWTMGAPCDAYHAVKNESFVIANGNSCWATREQTTIPGSAAYSFSTSLLRQFTSFDGMAPIKLPVYPFPVETVGPLLAVNLALQSHDT